MRSLPSSRSCANQGPLIRPALESAIGEDPEHPEIFILFGNLALAERRVTDAAVHFEKAKILAAAETMDRRSSGAASTASSIKVTRSWPRAEATGRPRGRPWVIG